MKGTLKPTRRAKSAVAVIVEIAQQGRDTPVSLSDVAATTGLSLSYMELLCADLRHRHLVRSFRGPGGGYQLAKPADQISLLDIALSMKEWPGARNNEERDGSSLNPQVQDLWDKLDKYQYLVWQQISLADVINGDLKDHPFLQRILAKPRG